MGRSGPGTGGAPAKELAAARLTGLPLIGWVVRDIRCLECIEAGAQCGKWQWHRHGRVTRYNQYSLKQQTFPVEFPGGKVELRSIDEVFVVAKPAGSDDPPACDGPAMDPAHWGLDPAVANAVAEAVRTAPRALVSGGAA